MSLKLMNHTPRLEMMNLESGLLQWVTKIIDVGKKRSGQESQRLRGSWELSEALSL